MAPSQGGERAERLTNTLFGAKAGGQHCQERALGLTSLRCTRRRCALATLSYDNMVFGPKFGRPKVNDIAGMVRVLNKINMIINTKVINRTTYYDIILK